MKALKSTTILVLLIALLGYGVRLINLGGDSLWFDEFLTLDNAKQDINSILSTQALDRPPGYYVVEHYTVRIFGSSEFALRLPSAVAGTLAIPLLYLLGQLIGSRRSGVLASLLLAVSPFGLRYSQEARGYSIQVALAVASSVCLWLALKHTRRRWWILFGVLTALNAYNLFGAFLVLAGQIAFVGTWWLIQALKQPRSTRQLLDVVVGLALAGVAAVILYLPYLQPALRGAFANIGPDARRAQWYGTPLIDWARAAYLAFGYLNVNGAALMGALSLIGLIGAIGRRQVDRVIWLLCGGAFPIVLVNLIGLARAPLPKYIIFSLPIYLLAVAMGLNTIIDLIAWRSTIGNRQSRLVFAATTAGIIVLSLTPLANEYAHVEEDWKSIVSYLKTAAHEGDIFVPLTLDLPDGFNQGVPALSHYLPQTFSAYYLLFGEHLTDPSVNDLNGVAKSDGQVWFVLLNRLKPVEFADPTIEVIPFKGSTYVVHSLRANRSPIEELIALYPQIIPQALTPAPQCYLWLDLATLELQQSRYEDAYQATLNFRTPCPLSVGIRQVIFQQLLDHYRQVQRIDRVDELARKLLLLDSKDQAALQALTVFDLSTLLSSNSISVTASSSPARPIQLQRLEMPQSGDWGEAIVMQTPAQLSYHLNLPPDSTEFRSRIAMAPESWDWGGDGSLFKVQIQDQTGHQATLYQSYVSNEDSDRNWHDVRLPLDQYAGQAITLTLVTEPGPNGDTTGDWAGWDSPRIVYTSP